MTPAPLHGHGLALWVSAICRLNGEDNGMTILWHNGIHSVDNPAPPGSSWGAKGSFLLLEQSVLTKGSAEVQSYKKLQWGSSFWELSGLNWVTYYAKFLPWYSVHAFFPGGWTDQVCWLWPGSVCAVCLYIQMGKLSCGKHCNSLHSCYGKREKWGNLLWIHLSRASGSWSHLLHLSPWSLILACLQLIYCFVKGLLFFSSVCISVTREMILTVEVWYTQTLVIRAGV